MKKLFIYVAMIGVAADVIYMLCKKVKFNNTPSKKADKKADFQPSLQKEDLSQNTNVTDDMYQAKSESAQAVHERHSEAGSLMKDAYSNIMEDFVEDSSNEKGANQEEKRKDIIIDDKSVAVMSKIVSISNDLNDLLK